eukprot:362930-Chlamydomonas_euryale.AAC.4
MKFVRCGVHYNLLAGAQTGKSCNFGNQLQQLMAGSKSQRGVGEHHFVGVGEGMTGDAVFRTCAYTTDQVRRRAYGRAAGGARGDAVAAAASAVVWGLAAAGMGGAWAAGALPSSWHVARRPSAA